MFAGSQDKPISKQEITSLIVNRKGRVLETYKDERVSRPKDLLEQFYLLLLLLLLFRLRSAGTH